MTKSYLIIGSSAAGLGNAMRLRDLDPTGIITLVTSEQEMPYNRCLLADLLSGNKTASQIATKTQTFFDEKNITLRRNARVVALDCVNKNVTLHTGEIIAYDKLFIGTGRSGWIPALPGSELTGVMPFYGLDDVTKILDFIKKNNVTLVTVIGGGLSGLECADALITQGLTINLIERTPHVLPHQLDSDGGAFLASLMRKNNVTLYAPDQVQEIQGKNSFVSGIKLATGVTLPAQMVIFAIGGKINSDLAQACNLEMHNNSILVNQSMQTSDPDIFAGGDVCAVPDLLTGQLVQSCLWPDAAQQGMTAAFGMTQQERKYPGIMIITSSHIYQTTFVTCGPISNPPAHFEKIVKQGPEFYHSFLVHDGQLKGFGMIGNVDNVGLLRKKMLDKTPFMS